MSPSRWHLVALPLAWLGGLGASGCARCDAPGPPDAAVVAPPAPPAPPVVRDAGRDLVDAAADLGAGPVHHAAKKPAAPPAGGGGGFKVEGNLGRAAAEKIVKGAAGKMRACFETAQAQNAALKGRVTFRLTIDDRGRVTLGEVVTSTLGDSDPEMCMIRATRDFKFPPVAGESKVTFQMNFGR